MSLILDTWRLNRDFLDTGGWVLFVIGAVTLLMWTLIIDRYWYLLTRHRRVVRESVATWNARDDTSSWNAHQVRRSLISRVAESLSARISLIKTLVALCPLLGLLGTVTGMIEVFEVMAASGNSNPRAMAAGVSKATIPTMAGMVAAISGFIFSAHLDRQAKDERERIAERLSPGMESPTLTEG